MTDKIAEIYEYGTLFTMTAPQIVSRQPYRISDAQHYLYMVRTKDGDSVPAPYTSLLSIMNSLGAEGWLVTLALGTSPVSLAFRETVGQAIPDAAVTNLAVWTNDMRRRLVPAD